MNIYKNKQAVGAKQFNCPFKNDEIYFNVGKLLNYLSEIFHNKFHQTLYRTHKVLC